MAIPAASSQPDYEHPSAMLRDAEVRSVEEVDDRAVSDRLVPPDEPRQDIGPPGVGRQRGDVLHHERLGAHLFDHVEEHADVGAPRVGRVHSPGHREAPARRPADHHLGITPPGAPLQAGQVSNDGRAARQRRPMSRQGNRVDVVGPHVTEAGPGEAEVEPAGTRVQRHARQ